MATVPLVRYEDATPAVRAVFDEIMRVRKVDEVNNFWKVLANHPDTLQRTWELVRAVMQPGELNEVTKEMIYVAVSITNNCEYCIHSHTAAAFKSGMTKAQHQELLAVVATAHHTNALANGFKVPVDAKFDV